MHNRAFIPQCAAFEVRGSNLAVGIATQPHMIRACEALCSYHVSARNLAVLPDRGRTRHRTYLAAFNTNTDQVIAAVPLIDPYPISTRFGVASEFDSRGLLSALQGWVVELGTICVVPEHRGRPQILRRLFKELNAHFARMNIAHVITLGCVPRRLGDNTLQAIIGRARASATMPFLPVRPWVAHPSIEPDGSKPPRIPSAIKTWLRAGGIIHPVPSWNACTNMAAFLMYMNVAAQPRLDSRRRPALRRLGCDINYMSEEQPFLACALK